MDDVSARNDDLKTMMRGMGNAAQSAARGLGLATTKQKNDALRGIVLNWTACQSADFQYYKLLKSPSSSSLSYPGSPVAFSTPNKNVTSHIDKSVASGATYHYRVGLRYFHSVHVTYSYI